MQRGKIYIFFCAFYMVVFLAAPRAMAALPAEIEAVELSFVDANGDTGYYIDENSVAFHGDDAADANIAIIRADENRLFLLDATIFFSRREYVVRAAKVYNYADKSPLFSVNKALPPFSIAPASPFDNIASFLAANHDR